MFHLKEAPPPSPAALFRGFCLIGLSGFGGVLPWARRYIVERYRWLPPAEFAALLGMCQIMPGPNVMNLALCLGARFHGWRGAIVAPLGMMLAPMAIVLALGLAYLNYGELAPMRAMLRGISAVGAGLILAAGLRMLWDYRRHAPAVGLALLVFAAIGWLRLPMLPVVALLLPAGILVAILRQRRPPGRPKDGAVTDAEPCSGEPLSPPPSGARTGFRGALLRAVRAGRLCKAFRGKGQGGG
jgi:chromate transporter